MNRPSNKLFVRTPEGKKTPKMLEVEQRLGQHILLEIELEAVEFDEDQPDIRRQGRINDGRRMYAGNDIDRETGHEPSRDRGRDLYYPFVSSGLGSGPFIELADGSVKLGFRAHYPQLETSIKGTGTSGVVHDAVTLLQSAPASGFLDLADDHQLVGRIESDADLDEVGRQVGDSAMEGEVIASRPASASAKASRVSLLSVSVGSIIDASGTTSGKYTVGAW